MKRLVERFRRWLIKKLGGYTERYMPIPAEKPIAFKTAEIPTITVKAVCDVHACTIMRLGDLETKRAVVDSLLTEMARQLFASKCVRISHEEDLRTGGRTYRAVVRLLPPEAKEDSVEEIIDKEGSEHE